MKFWRKLIAYLSCLTLYGENHYEAIGITTMSDPNDDQYVWIRAKKLSGSEANTLDPDEGVNTTFDDDELYDDTLDYDNSYNDDDSNWDILAPAGIFGGVGGLIWLVYHCAGKTNMDEKEKLLLKKLSSSNREKFLELLLELLTKQSSINNDDNHEEILKLLRNEDTFVKEEDLSELLKKNKEELIKLLKDQNTLTRFDKLTEKNSKSISECKIEAKNIINKFDIQRIDFQVKMYSQLLSQYDQFIKNYKTKKKRTGTYILKKNFLDKVSSFKKSLNCLPFSENLKIQIQNICKLVLNNLKYFENDIEHFVNMELTWGVICKLVFQDEKKINLLSTFLESVDQCKKKDDEVFNSKLICASYLILQDCYYYDQLNKKLDKQATFANILKLTKDLIQYIVKSKYSNELIELCFYDTELTRYKAKNLYNFYYLIDVAFQFIDNGCRDKDEKYVKSKYNIIRDWIIASYFDSSKEMKDTTEVWDL